MEASIKTILLEFKVFQDQMTSFVTEIISKLHENNPSEKLQIIYKKENPGVSIQLHRDVTKLNLVHFRSVHFFCDF